MADAFFLPADLGLTLTKSAFSLDHDGDVSLHQTLGRTLERVRASGDLTLALDNVTGSIHADGVVHITGDVDADTIYGREVHLHSTSIKARAISASEKIVIGEAKLKVDVLLAPEIDLDSGVNGRVTVIECNGDLPASRLRGGYTLEEYEEDFGDSAAFLAERGVNPLGEAAEAPQPAEDSDEEEEEDDEDDEGDPTESVDRETTPPDESDEHDEEEDEDDPISLNDEQLEPVDADDDELYPKLSEALERIVSCYDDELPPSVEQLQTNIEARDYDTLRANITDVWTGLLGYHQQRGIRPHHQVTHAFNVIHGLVTEA